MANGTFTGQISEPTPVKQTAPLTGLETAASVLPTVVEAGTAIAQANQVSHIADVGAALNDVQTEAVKGASILQELNKSLMDDTSKTNVKNVFNQLSALQSGQTQGAITPSEAKVRAATVFRRAVAANPGLQPEYERLYGALGFSASQGSTSGKTGMPILDAAQEAYGNLVKKAISTGQSIDGVIQDNYLSAQAQHSSDLATIAANNGKLNLPFAIQAVGQNASQVTDTIFNAFAEQSKVKGSEVDIGQFKAAADLQFLKLKQEADALIANNNAKGATFTTDQINQIYGRIDQEHQALITALSNSDPAAYLQRRNEVRKNIAVSEMQDITTQLGGGLAPAVTAMSPDNQSKYILGAANILSQLSRAGDNQRSVRSKFEESARLSGDPDLTIMMSLVDNAKAGPLMAFLGNQAASGDLSGSAGTAQIKEGIISSTIDEGSDLSDPPALGALTKAISSANSSSISTGNLTKPQVIDQARKSETVKVQLNNSIGNKTARIIDEVGNTRSINEGYSFNFNPQNPRPFSATASIPAFGAMSEVPSTSVPKVTQGINTEQTRQLNDFYQFKTQTDGPQAALKWARDLMEQINPQPSLDNAGDDEVYFRVK